MERLIDIVLILLLLFNLIFTCRLNNKIETAIQVEEMIIKDSINLLNNEKCFTTTHR